MSKLKKLHEYFKKRVEKHDSKDKALSKKIDESKSYIHSKEYAKKRSKYEPQDLRKEHDEGITGQY